MKRNILSCFAKTAILFLLTISPAAADSASTGHDHDAKSLTMKEGEEPADATAGTENESSDIQKELALQRSKFRKESENLRAEILSKRFLLQSELVKPNPSVESVEMIQKDLSDLTGELDLLRIRHVLAMKKIDPKSVYRFTMKMFHPEMDMDDVHEHALDDKHGGGMYGQKGMKPGMGMHGMGMRGKGMKPGMGMHGMGMRGKGMKPGMGMHGMGMRGKGMKSGMGMHGMGMKDEEMNAGRGKKAGKHAGSLHHAETSQEKMRKAMHMFMDEFLDAYLKSQDESEKTSGYAEDTESN
jgi:hypothetical protein